MPHINITFSGYDIPLKYFMFTCNTIFLQDGETALHKAATFGHVNVVNMLLSNYPNMMKKTNNVSS